MFQENFANKVSTEKNRLEGLRRRLESELSDVVRRIGAAERLMEMGEEITSSLNTLFGPNQAPAERGPEPDVADDPQPAKDPEPDVKKVETGAETKLEEPSPSPVIADIKPVAVVEKTKAPIPVKDYPAKRRGRSPKQDSAEEDQDLPPRVKRIYFEMSRIQEVMQNIGVSYQIAVIYLCAREIDKNPDGDIPRGVVDWKLMAGLNINEEVQGALVFLERNGYMKILPGGKVTVPRMNPVADGGNGVIEPASKAAVLLGLIRRAQTADQAAMFDMNLLEKKLGTTRHAVTVAIRALFDKGYIQREPGELKNHVFLRAREA